MLDGGRDDMTRELLLLRQAVEHGDGDRSRVDLEVPAQRNSRIAATVSVGAERDEGNGDESPDLIGHRLHVVGDRNDRSALTAQLLIDVRDAWLGVRVEAVPALDLERVLAQQLE